MNYSIPSLARTLALLTLSSLAADAAEAPIPLWPRGAPGTRGDAKGAGPTLTPYLSANPSGAAMLLIPGGSYGGIYAGQAEPFALWLNSQGIAAFVLRYRLGSEGHRYPSQLQDAVEAMRQLRENAERWKIDPGRVGAMGFSAGGHLVTTLLATPEDGEVAGGASQGRPSSRPDLAVICYPVISMIAKPHAASKRNLLGDSPGDELVRRASSELQVRPGLPPIFLWHTYEDALVPVEHALLYAAALRQHGVPHELHLYQHGDHGTGLVGTAHPWFNDLVSWLRSKRFLAEAGRAP